MKKRIIAILLVTVFFALPVSVFADYELDCSEADYPFSLIMQNQNTDILFGEFEKPVIIYEPNIYTGDLEILDELTEVIAFGNNTVFSFTNKSLGGIRICFYEFPVAIEPLYFGSYYDGGAGFGFFENKSFGIPDEFFDLTGCYYSKSYQHMGFVNKPGKDFELYSLLEEETSHVYYDVKKGETVTFTLPIQNRSLCELDFVFLDGNGKNINVNGTDVMSYVLMRDDDLAASNTVDNKMDQPSAWAAAEVTAAIDSGLVPENLQHNYTVPVSREDVAQMFVNLIEKVCGKTIDDVLIEKGLKINPNAFSDTKNRAVLACNALGIINGVGNNSFDPNGTFTRGQIAAILNRIAGALGIDTNGYTHSFTDVGGHWCSAELGWPVQAGIINGVGNNRFDPDGKLTTEQAIVIAYRALSKIR